MVLDTLHQGPVTSSSYGCAIRVSLFYTLVGKDEGGHWLLVIGHWFLVIGHWFLVIGLG